MKESIKPSAQLVSDLVRIVTAGAVLAGCTPREAGPTVNPDPTEVKPANTLVVPELTPTSEPTLVPLPVGSEPTASPTVDPAVEATPTQVLSSETVPLKSASELPELAGIQFDMEPIQQLYPQLSNLELLAATNGMQGDALRYTAVIKATEGDKPVLVMPMSITYEGKEYAADYPSYFEAKAGGVLTPKMEGVVYTLVEIDGNPLTVYWNQEYPTVGQTSAAAETEAWTKVELAEKDDWPFPEDPVVESIKLTEDEMKEKNPEFYNEVAPILANSGIVVEKWMQHPETGEVFILVHHQDGGGQFMMTDYEYSNGHVLLGFNTRETGIAMENKWLQPVDDGRLLAITLQNAPDGNSMESLWLDLAAMAHLRNRVGQGNMPGTLETMRDAIAAERANLGNDRINFVYLVTPTARGENLDPAPFPKMHDFIYNNGVVSLKTDMMLELIPDGSIIMSIGLQIDRSMFSYAYGDFLRGTVRAERAINDPSMAKQLSELPELLPFKMMEGSLLGSIKPSTMANLAEDSMENSWFVTNPDDFLSKPIELFRVASGVSANEMTEYRSGQRNLIPDKYVSNVIEWQKHIYVGAQLVK